MESGYIGSSLSCQITDVTNLLNRYILGTILSSSDSELANLDFAALIRAASSGDRDAQTQICQRYEPKV